MSIMIDTPFRVDGIGGIASTSSLARQTAVRIGQLVATAHYERPMRALYGTNARTAVFESLTSGLALTIEVDLQAAITRFEPDIVLAGVNVVRAPVGAENGGDSTLSLQVAFRVPTVTADATFTATITVAGEVTEVLQQ